jgi:hypothetical protein
MGHADEPQHLVRLMSILGVLITCHLSERDRQSADQTANFILRRIVKKRHPDDTRIRAYIHFIELSGAIKVAGRDHQFLFF